MSQAEAFLESLRENEALRDEVKALGGSPSKSVALERAVDMGRRHGYAFTAEEMDDAWTAYSEDDAELTEEELEAVAGGASSSSIVSCCCCC